MDPVRIGAGWCEMAPHFITDSSPSPALPCQLTLSLPSPADALNSNARQVSNQEFQLSSLSEMRDAASQVSAREWGAGPGLCANPSHNERFNMKLGDLCMRDVWKCTFTFANVGLTFISVGLAYGLKVWVCNPKVVGLNTKQTIVALN